MKKKPYPPLWRAIEKHDLEKTRSLLLKYGDINKSALHPESRVPWSPLFMAVSNDFLDAVRLLLAAGANANGSKDDWDHPLIAAAQTDRLDIVKTLVEAGANINVQTKGHKDERGRTPLIVALQHRKEQTARLLLRLGADPKVTTPAGITALTEASLLGDVDLCKSLMASGCPVSGKCVLNAVFAGHGHVLRLLLEHGGDPNYVETGDEPKGIKGCNPLGQTLELIEQLGGKPSLALILLEFGAEPNLMMHGIPPLSKAAGRGLVKIVKALLKAGADPNRLDQGGWTPLAWSAGSGQVEVAKLLLKAGADPMHSGPTIHGKPSRNAIEMAQERGQLEVLKLLTKRPTAVRARGKATRLLTTATTR